MKIPEFKIYFLICPKTGDIKYVGKTKNKLSYRINEHLNDKKITHKRNWIVHLRRNGLTPIVKLVKTCRDEIKCNYAEKFYIKLLGRLDKNEGLLLNHTDGGDGACGGKWWIGKEHKQESKLKMSLAKKGKYKGENHHLYGKHPSDETRHKQSLAKKGKINWRKGKRMVEYIVKKCKICDNDFEVPPYKIKKECCSEKCGYKLSGIRKRGRLAWNSGKKGLYKHSEEWKLKMSEASKGKPKSIETRNRMSLSKRGTRHTSESRSKMSKSHLGKKQNSETILKRVNKLKKKVVQLDAQNNIIRIWDSFKDIKFELGFYPKRITWACQGKIKTAYKFIWKYADEHKRLVA